MSPMRDQHARARELLLTHKLAELSEAEQSWLRVHLSACGDCSRNAEHLGAAVKQLRAVSAEIVAGRPLVRAAQMRVRERAEQLHQNRERMSPIVIACALACVWAIGAVPLSWHGFSSLAQTWQLPAMIWQVAAVLFALAPAALITAIGISMRRERSET
jgi:hypothetical protein